MKTPGTSALIEIRRFLSRAGERWRGTRQYLTCERQSTSGKSPRPLVLSQTLLIDASASNTSQLRIASTSALSASRHSVPLVRALALYPTTSPHIITRTGRLGAWNRFYSQKNVACILEALKSSRFIVNVNIRLLINIIIYFICLWSILKAELLVE